MLIGMRGCRVPATEERRLNENWRLMGGDA